MTRPPVGSTGTLAELQVEAGDVVEFERGSLHRIVGCISGRYYSSDEHMDAERPWLSTRSAWTLISRANPDQPLQIEAGKYYRTRDGRKVGPMVYDRDTHTEYVWDDKATGRSYDGIGRQYGDRFQTDDDLIAEWQEDQPAHVVTHEGRTYDLTALETPFGLLPEPVQVALDAWPHGIVWYDGVWRAACGRCHGDGFVHRAVPAPVETRVECYRGEYYKRKEHGTCIKRPDGSIDWASWEDAE